MTNRHTDPLNFLAKKKLGKDFDDIKFDNKYSKQSRSYKYISELFNKDFESSELNSARDILKKWDLATNFKNTSAALGVRSIE